MTAQNLPQHYKFEMFSRRAFQGVAIAFILLTLFLIVNFIFLDPPEIGYWTLISYLTVSFGGAMGGIFFYLLQPFRNMGGWKKAAANVLSCIVYIIGLWISLVIALALTGLWD
jgi:hypothetical protein